MFTNSRIRGTRGCLLTRRIRGTRGCLPTRELEELVDVY